MLQTFKLLSELAYNVTMMLSYLFNMKQKLLEAFDLHAARLLRVRPRCNVDVDDLSRIVNTGRRQATESSLKLCCSTTQ